MCCKKWECTCRYNQYPIYDVYKQTCLRVSSCKSKSVNRLFTTGQLSPSRYSVECASRRAATQKRWGVHKIKEIHSLITSRLVHVMNYEWDIIIKYLNTDSANKARGIFWKVNRSLKFDIGQQVYFGVQRVGQLVQSTWNSNIFYPREKSPSKRINSENLLTKFEQISWKANMHWHWSQHFFHVLV